MKKRAAHKRPNYNRGTTAGQRSRYAKQVERNRAAYRSEEAQAKRAAKEQAEREKREAKERAREEREILKAEYDAVIDSLDRMFQREAQSGAGAAERENAYMLIKLLEDAKKAKIGGHAMGKAAVMERLNGVLSGGVIEQLEEWAQAEYQKKYSRWGSKNGRDRYEAFINKLKGALGMATWSFNYGGGRHIDWNMSEEDYKKDIEILEWV